ILRVNSSLREWGDWKRDVERVFEGKPDTYRKGRQRIIKALDYVDKSLKTLWYTYRDQKDKRDTTRWNVFIKWTRDNIQNGQNATATLYERYEGARQKQEKSPVQFNAYLSAIERDLPQFKSADITIPESRSECVAVAQRVWEGLNADKKTTEYRQTNRRPYSKEKRNFNYRQAYKGVYGRDSRGPHRDWHRTSYRQDNDGGEDNEKSRTQKTQETRDHQNRCYKCGKSGHFAPNCPEKN
ncbi:hypothetical protein V1509DRAFT_555045, partial [Lipomyces kononenkoae]